MSKKSNQALLGVILVMAGIYAFINLFFEIPAISSSWNMTFLIIGGAMLFLYHTKGKQWALILGSICTLIGVLSIMPSLPAIGGALTGAMVFVIPGFVFMSLFFTKRVIGFLIPGSILLWFGAFIVFAALPFPEVFKGSAFFIFLGMAFITMYVLGNRQIGRWPLIPGGILIAFGFFIVAASSIGFIFSMIPKLLPIILILIGIGVIVKGTKNQ